MKPFTIETWHASFFIFQPGHHTLYNMSSFVVVMHHSCRELLNFFITRTNFQSKDVRVRLPSTNNITKSTFLLILGKNFKSNVSIGTISSHKPLAIFEIKPTVFLTVPSLGLVNLKQI